MDLMKKSGIEAECNLELLYNKMCRICLETSDEMDHLFTLEIPSEPNNIIVFLRKITELKIPECDKFPDKICNKCKENIISSFNLVKLCVESDAILTNQETRRLLRKLEAEVLEDDTILESAEQKESEESLLVDEIKSECEVGWNTIKEEIESQTDVKTADKYSCEKCMLSFSNKIKFDKHLKTHDLTKQLKCDQCPQVFSKELHLKVHLRSHIKKEDRQFVCSICDEKFIFEYLLKQHSYKHTDKKPFPCKKCGKGCLTAESLRRHINTHDQNYQKKSHVCHICNKSFAYPSFLEEHKKNHTGERPHLCSICGKGFRQSGALHYHQRIHTGYKPFQCPICNEHFMSKSVLKVHFRKHTNERPYVCDFCGVSFRQSTDLKSHHRIHTGEKRVLCTFCGKKLSTTGQLTVHLRTHTGEKPYCCPDCNKSFTTRTSLVKHQRIHTGERPYVCDICGKSFNQSSTLKTHSNTHKSSVCKKGATPGLNTS